MFEPFAFKGQGLVIIKTEPNRFILEVAPGREGPPCFRQGDPRWGSNLIGTDTVARYGCLLTTLASLAAWRGYETDPGRALDDLKKAGCFGGNYLNHPTKVQDVYPQLRWHVAQTYYSPMYQRYESSLIDWSAQPVDLQLLAELLDRQPIPIQVDYNPITDDIEPHFVLAIRYTPAPEGTLEDDLLIMDPITGTYTSVLTYFNPAWFGTWMKKNDVTKVARTVVGARVWEVK